MILETILIKSRKTDDVNNVILPSTSTLILGQDSDRPIVNKIATW